MKLKNCELVDFSHSPSGQIVVHVKTDAGHCFQMPFGPEATIEEIAPRVEEYVSSSQTVAERAQILKNQLPARIPEVLPPEIPQLPGWIRLLLRIHMFFAKLFRRSP